MVENQQDPAWLASLREQQPGESPRTAEDLQEQMGQADMGEELQEQIGQVDMVEDLREQMIQAGEELEYEKKAPLTQLFPNLEPWQRLVLVVLLFLNVALCGCMALVMAGRVMLPF